MKQVTLKKHSVAYLKTHQSVLLNEHLSYAYKRKVEMGTQKKKKLQPQPQTEASVYSVFECNILK